VAKGSSARYAGFVEVPPSRVARPRFCASAGSAGLNWAARWADRLQSRYLKVRQAPRTPVVSGFVEPPRHGTGALRLRSGPRDRLPANVSASLNERSRVAVRPTSSRPSAVTQRDAEGLCAVDVRIYQSRRQAALMHYRHAGFPTALMVLAGSATWKAMWWTFACASRTPSRLYRRRPAGSVPA